MTIAFEKEIIIKLKKLNRTEKKEVRDFVDFLYLKNHAANETALLSEGSLKDWLNPDEEAAWKNL